MRIGILGFKFTGKTTLFNAVTGSDQPVGQGGVEPHLAMGRIPDPRLDRLTEMFVPRRTIHAAVEWVDVPGFEPTAPGGAGEATRFLEHARRVEALAQVVRCFDNGLEPPAPQDEIESLALELTIADLQIVENRLERLTKDKQRKGKVDNALEPPLMERFKARLEDGKPLRDLELSPDEIKLSSGYSLLTLKPMILVLNGSEDGVDPAVIAAARETGAEVVDLCAQVEAELAELTEAERAEFLADLGIEEPASHRMARSAYDALGLLSFFTVGEDECRAWTVCRGALAPEAAGTIHSDMERGFIRAETCSYDDLVAAGGLAEVKKANRMRLEGKAYEVKDGDVLNIRFSV
ncbi:redox-regulated ATPase YchF [bacterium]|nr:redox-regulated ATPase YchF [bacterium]